LERGLCSWKHGVGNIWLGAVCMCIIPLHVLYYRDHGIILLTFQRPSTISKTVHLPPG
jgi:hypothetical protein